MKSDSGRTTSIWMRTAEMPSHAPLNVSTACDVCVVGAGIAGLTTAYLLAKAGRRVVVLDDGPIAGGETSRTTAHLTNAIDDRYIHIERWHGPDLARVAAAAHTEAIETIERIVREEQIACDFTRLDGYLFPCEGEDPQLLDEELAAARRCGVPGVEMLDHAPLSTFDTGRAIHFPNQGQFHVLKYLQGLARCIERDGGRIHANTKVTAVTGGDQATIETAGGHTITAGAVVVATNAPINDRVVIHTKLAHYRTFVVGARVARGSVPQALYWDTADPYHYVRLQRDETGDGFDILIVGGEDHKTGQDEGRPADVRYAALETWARKHFPQLGEVVYRWSGQVAETADGLAYIGRNPLDKPNVFVITGDSGMGMTHGTIGGVVVSSLITSGVHRYAELFDPSRIVRSSFKDWVSENFNVARQYTDWIMPGDVKSSAELSAGQGAIIQSGAGKLACFRDEAGTLHEFNAVCPHLGCVVQFNAEEKSWDCPCHGSRFSATDGHVLNGPANGPLLSGEEREKAA